MWYVFVPIAVLFVLIGLAVHVGKWYFLIAGYNTMTREEQARVNTEALGRLLGIYCYVNAAIFLLMGVFTALDISAGVNAGLVLFGVSTVYVLVKAQKYDGNLFDDTGRLRRGAWRKLVVVLGILLVVAVAVGVLTYYSSQPAQVAFLDEGLQVQGMYGDVYGWDTIQDAFILETLPKIEARTNGSAIGSHLKGHFRTKEYGAVKLFVDKKTPPFVYFKSGGEVVIFNLSDPEQTRAAYEEIVNRTR
jgi:hypothetical protein